MVIYKTVSIKLGVGFVPPVYREAEAKTQQYKADDLINYRASHHFASNSLWEDPQKEGLGAKEKTVFLLYNWFVFISQGPCESHY